MDHALPAALDPATVADAARQLAEILGAVERGEIQAGRDQRNRLRGAAAVLDALAGPTAC